MFEQFGIRKIFGKGARHNFQCAFVIESVVKFFKCRFFLYFSEFVAVVVYRLAERFQQRWVRAPDSAAKETIIGFYM